MSRSEATIGDPYSEFRQYLSVLRKRKLSVIIVTLIALGVAAAWSYRQTEMYVSEAEVIVRPPFIRPDDVLGDSTVNLDTEKEQAESDSLAKVAAESLPSTAPRDFAAGLSVDVADEAEVLIFHYSDPDPKTAQLRAQAAATAYLQLRRQNLLKTLSSVSKQLQIQVRTLDERLAKINQQVAEEVDPEKRASLQAEANSLAASLVVLQIEALELTPPDSLDVGEVVERARSPSSPESPNHLRDGLLALILGLGSGIGLAFLRERLDDSLRGADDLEAVSGTAVLAAVPRISRWKRRRRTLESLTDPRSAAAEAYTSLGAVVVFAASRHQARTLLITSPNPGDGRTTIASNLAVVLAQAGKRVILLSTDLRKPRLHQFFGIENRVGLTDVLDGKKSPWRACIDSSVETLQVLPSGPVPDNPMKLLGSDALTHLLSTYKEVADFVLLDSPPVLPVADAVTLASLADAVILVADAGSTDRSAVAQARRQLDQATRHIIGSVLNRSDPSKLDAYRYARQRHRKGPRPDEAHSKFVPGNGRRLDFLRPRRSGRHAWTKSRNGNLMNDDITGNDDDSKDRDKWHPPIDPAPTAALVAEVNQLLEETEDVEAAVIIDQRGLPIVSAPPGNIDESRLTTTGVSLVALGQRAMQGAGRGNPTHVLTEGPDGQVILMFAGDRAALLVLAGHRIAPGPLLSRMRQVSDRIASHMQDPRTQPPPTGDG